MNPTSFQRLKKFSILVRVCRVHAMQVLCLKLLANIMKMLVISSMPPSPATPYVPDPCTHTTSTWVTHKCAGLNLPMSALLFTSKWCHHPPLCKLKTALSSSLLPVSLILPAVGSGMSTPQAVSFILPAEESGMSTPQDTYKRLIPQLRTFGG